MTDLEELERLAKAATPGPWEVVTHLDGGDPVVVMSWMRGRRMTLTEEDSTLLTSENAHYIAAANPAVVLKLIARVRQLEGGDATFREVLGGAKARPAGWSR